MHANAQGTPCAPFLFPSALFPPPAPPPPPPLQHSSTIVHTTCHATCSMQHNQGILLFSTQVTWALHFKHIMDKGIPAQHQMEHLLGNQRTSPECPEACTNVCSVAMDSVAENIARVCAAVGAQSVSCERLFRRGEYALSAAGMQTVRLYKHPDIPEDPSTHLRRNLHAVQRGQRDHSKRAEPFVHHVCRGKWKGACVPVPRGALVHSANVATPLPLGTPMEVLHAVQHSPAEWPAPGLGSVRSAAPRLTRSGEWHVDNSNVCMALAYVCRVQPELRHATRAERWRVYMPMVEDVQPSAPAMHRNVRLIFSKASYTTPLKAAVVADALQRAHAVGVPHVNFPQPGERQIVTVRRADAVEALMYWDVQAGSPVASGAVCSAEGHRSSGVAEKPSRSAQRHRSSSICSSAVHSDAAQPCRPSCREPAAGASQACSKRLACTPRHAAQAHPALATPVPASSCLCATSRLLDDSPLRVPAACRTVAAWDSPAPSTAGGSEGTCATRVMHGECDSSRTGSDVADSVAGATWPGALGAQCSLLATSPCSDDVLALPFPQTQSFL